MNEEEMERRLKRLESLLSKWGYDTPGLQSSMQFTYDSAKRAYAKLQAEKGHQRVNHSLEQHVLIMREATKSRTLNKICCAPSSFLNHQFCWKPFRHEGDHRYRGIEWFPAPANMVFLKIPAILRGVKTI